MVNFSVLLRSAFVRMAEAPSLQFQEGWEVILLATKLYVGNLPFGLESAKLQEVFQAAGNVVSAQVITDKYSGRSKGFGFVEMGSDEEAGKAIEMFNGKDLDGRNLVVNEARPREERPDGGDRGGDRRGGGGNRFGRRDYGR